MCRDVPRACRPLTFAASRPDLRNYRRLSKRTTLPRAADEVERPRRDSTASRLRTPVRVTYDDFTSPRLPSGPRLRAGCATRALLDDLSGGRAACGPCAAPPDWWRPRIPLPPVLCVTQCATVIPSAQRPRAPVYAAPRLRLVRVVRARFRLVARDQRCAPVTAGRRRTSQASGAPEFGAFSVAYVTYAFVLNASPGCPPTAALRYSHARVTRMEARRACCTTTAILSASYWSACWPSDHIHRDDALCRSRARHRHCPADSAGPAGVTPSSRAGKGSNGRLRFNDTSGR